MIREDIGRLHLPLGPKGRRTRLAKFCHRKLVISMSTMHIALPDSLKAFVDEQVRQRGFGTSSEYVRELLRREQEHLQLCSLLLAGASSMPSAPADEAYFEGLRTRIGSRAESSRTALRRP